MTLYCNTFLNSLISHIHDFFKLYLSCYLMAMIEPFVLVSVVSLIQLVSPWYCERRLETNTQTYLFKLSMIWILLLTAECNAACKMGQFLQKNSISGATKLNQAANMYFQTRSAPTVRIWNPANDTLHPLAYWRILLMINFKWNLSFLNKS